MARSYLKCDRTNDFGYGEIAVNRIPSTSREVLCGRSWSLAVMFLDVMTKLDIWSNVNVPACVGPVNYVPNVRF